MGGGSPPGKNSILANSLHLSELDRGTGKRIVNFLSEHGVDHVVTLLRSDEGQFEGIGQGCTASGVGWTHIQLSGANLSAEGVSFWFFFTDTSMPVSSNLGHCQYSSPCGYYPTAYPWQECLCSLCSGNAPNRHSLECLFFHAYTCFCR